MVDNGAGFEVAAESTKARRSKRQILWTLLAYAMFLGLASVIFPYPDDNPLLDLILSLPFLILAVTWCSVDANARHHRIGKLMRVGLVLFFVMAFPIYLFQTRGVGAFKTLFLTVLFIGAIAACLVGPPALLIR